MARSVRTALIAHVGRKLGSIVKARWTPGTAWDVPYSTSLGAPSITCSRHSDDLKVNPQHAIFNNSIARLPGLTDQSQPHAQANMSATSRLTLHLFTCVGADVHMLDCAATGLYEGHAWNLPYI
jgi:hypothetical protein